MGKSLYSLTLMDEVVSRIDTMAWKKNMSRSALINEILAEYAMMTTPEKRTDSIFRMVEEFFSGNDTLVPFIGGGRMSMSLKSSIEYKYRPTVRYEVQLYRTPEDGAIGELSVNFRTRAPQLIGELSGFFSFWKELEDTYLSGRLGVGEIRYGLYDCKFTRGLYPEAGRDHTNDEIGEAISKYIGLLDGALKGYLTHTATPSGIEKKYIEYALGKEVI